jgi:hypothetical protein
VCLSEPVHEVSGGSGWAEVLESKPFTAKDAKNNRTGNQDSAAKWSGAELRNC